jgi:exopolysaccharide production protein ExoQ
MGFHTPPTVALLFTIGFIIFLFRRDIREQPNVTGALWLPLLWLVFIGSRSPAQWLSLGNYVRSSSMEEGTPLDACVFFILIASSFYILNKRQVSLSEIFRNNGWLMAFLLYCLVAILWSDFPFVAFKRWIKILGHPIMVLILFTEPDPEEAVVRLLKRTAYFFVPMSILFLKYYPEWGRGYDDWTGMPSNNGINTNKNELGWMCMILGFFFFWHWLKTWRTERSRARRNELLWTAGFLGMIWWLLLKAGSATSDFSLLIAGLIVLALGLRSVNKRSIGVYVLLAIAMLVAGELTFGIFGRIVAFSGHGDTIAGRGDLWRELLAFHTNPIIGVGFESFWLGDRLQALWGKHWWRPTEAHNGYLETYLNLGLVGLLMLIGLIIATFRKIRLELLRNFQFGRFRLGLLVAIVVFNWTEASFKGLSPIWFIFYVIAMDYPGFKLGPVEQFSVTDSREAEIGVGSPPVESIL